MTHVIETIRLTRRYRGLMAVDGIDLVVPQGAAMVLVGANGAGKSTTLQMLMGLVKPSSGQALLLGRDSTALQAADFKQIGYATENQILPDYMTADAWFDYLRPVYPGWDVGREMELRRRFDLPGGRRLKSMSRGERMKSCAAAAMAFRPSLLVMDEPLSGLDPLSREEMVRALIEDAGETSMLISSHDLNEIERVATHVALVHKGRLVLQEETEKLTSRHREVSMQMPGEDMPASLPASWINPRRSAGLFAFVETRFGGEDLLRKEVASRIPAGAGLIVAPMSLASISGAAMRHAQTSTPQSEAA